MALLSNRHLPSSNQENASRRGVNEGEDEGSFGVRSVAGIDGVLRNAKERSNCLRKAGSEENAFPNRSVLTQIDDFGSESQFPSGVGKIGRCRELLASKLRVCPLSMAGRSLMIRGESGCR